MIPHRLQTPHSFASTIVYELITLGVRPYSTCSPLLYIIRVHHHDRLHIVTAVVLVYTMMITLRSLALSLGHHPPFQRPRHRHIRQLAPVCEQTAVGVVPTLASGVAWDHLGQPAFVDTHML